MMRPERIVVMTVAVTALACPRPSLYQRWGTELGDIPRRHGRVEDVSLLLGSPPTECEQVDHPVPMIGIIANRHEPSIDDVLPGSPAAEAGLRAGDKVLAAARVPISKADQFGQLIRLYARAG